MGRERVERRQLRRDDAHQRVDALEREDAGEHVTALKLRDERFQFVQQHLEPELTCLVHDDEEELVGMLRARPRTLQGEQLLEREIRPIGNLAGAARGMLAQKVDTSSAAMSSTRMVSCVKKGSPYRVRICDP
jgi:hypothetical protein